MTEPTLHFIHCPDAANGHRMAYWSWGHPEADHVVLCVHGLTRQGRDFDVLARALCERAERAGQRLRVVCPDVVGRGNSDWLADPMAYQVPTYAAATTGQPQAQARKGLRIPNGSAHHLLQASGAWLSSKVR